MVGGFGGGMISCSSVDRDRIRISDHAGSQAASMFERPVSTQRRERFAKGACVTRMTVLSTIAVGRDNSPRGGGGIH
jgi:hypothetical protein